MTHYVLKSILCTFMKLLTNFDFSEQISFYVKSLIDFFKNRTTCRHDTIYNNNNLFSVTDSMYIIHSQLTRPNIH